MYGFMCPRCSGEMLPMPVEPLYLFAEAALIVPCSPAHIKKLASVHKNKLMPPIYRRHPSNPHLRVRYLYGSDIAVLRGVLFSNVLHKPRKVKEAP